MSFSPIHEPRDQNPVDGASLEAKNSDSIQEQALEPGKPKFSLSRFQQKIEQHGSTFAYITVGMFLSGVKDAFLMKEDPKPVKDSSTRNPAPPKPTRQEQHEGISARLKAQKAQLQSLEKTELQQQVDKGRSSSQKQKLTNSIQKNEKELALINLKRGFSVAGAVVKAIFGIPLMTVAIGTFLPLIALSALIDASHYAATNRRY